MRTLEQLKAYKRQWQLNNRDKFRAYNKKYYQKNKEQVLAYTSKWKKDNRAKVCLYAKRSAAKNPQRIKAYREKYKRRALMLKNKRRAAKRNALIVLGLKSQFRSDKTGLSPAQLKRRWVENNREKLRDYYKNVCSKNPQWVMKRRLSARIYKILKRSGLKKRLPALKYIGTDVLGFRKHIESLFKPGMTWVNRSLWHIDHKLPCSSFDLTIEAEQMKCFHYTNLQPLWWWENLSKSDKIAA